MAKYHVVLAAVVPAWCSVTVDADNESVACKTAIRLAPRDAGAWEIVPAGAVSEIWTGQVEEAD